MTTDLLRPPLRVKTAAARSSVADVFAPLARGAYRDLRRPGSRSAPAWVARTDFDPTRPEAIADPYPEFARLREHPIVVNERLGVWMLARYQDVYNAVRDHERFASTHGVLLRSFAPGALAFVDPPDHDRLCQELVTPLFTKKAVARLTGDIRESAAHGVAALAKGDVVDMVPALCDPLPINVLARILGIPRDQSPAFRHVSDAFARMTSPRTVAENVSVFGTLLSAYIRLRSYVSAETASRAGDPGEDLLSCLGVAVEKGRITDHEAFWTALVVLVAGNETTSSLLGMVLTRLAQDPALFAELRADRSLLRGTVEETLRWGSPAQWQTRVATTPVAIGETVIPRGGRVVLFFASANRDLAKFPDPNTYDIHRNTTGHLAFGHGAHFCLGAHLARLETITALDYLLDEVEGLELAAPVRWGTTPSLRGLVSVPVRAIRRPSS